jgi:hypothetical protein
MGTQENKNGRVSAHIADSLGVGKRGTKASAHVVRNTGYDKCWKEKFSVFWKNIKEGLGKGGMTKCWSSQKNRDRMFQAEWIVQANEVGSWGRRGREVR